MYKRENEGKQEVDLLFRPVVWDASVQGDAITELSVVAVLFIFPLGVSTVLSQSGSSPPLAKASGALNEPHGLRQTCRGEDAAERKRESQTDEQAA